MPRLSVEIQDTVKPIILFLGDNTFTKHLIEKHEKDFKIAHVSDEHIETTHEKDFYRIRRSSVNLIGSLEETIDYAVIYPGKQDRHLLPPIFEKLEHDQAKILILIDIRSLDDFYDIILNYKTRDNIKFLFVGDIYAEHGEYLETKLGEILEDAIHKKTAKLTGNDLEPIFPIYLKDAINGVGQHLFSGRGQHKFYYLFYSHPLTLISAIHVISRVEPDLEIKYGEIGNIEKKEKDFDEIQGELKSKLNATPVFMDKYLAGFEKSIHLFNNIRHDKKETLAHTIEILEVPKKVLPKKQHVNVFTRAFIAAFFLFIVFNFIFIAISAFQLRNATQAFEKNEYDKVASNINSAKILLEISEPTIELLARSIGAIGIKSVEANFEKAQSGIDLLSLASRDLNTLQGITGGIDRVTLDRIISDATYIYFRAEEKKEDMQSETLNTLLTPDLSKMASIAQVLPDLLGYNEEKNYLILFQNNGELRPTGGFIGSVGEAKFSGGALVDLKIEDVYEYDGQLKAHIEPHYIIRRYLQPHLYLRDSNFNPDFQESAASAAQVFELETGRKVDGVIALNFEGVKLLIEELGPLSLPSYNKTLTSENTFDFLQTTIDDNFFPGSSAKRDVLQALFNQITLKLENDKSSFIKIARLIPKLMNQKDIIFAFNTNSIQGTFSANGYGGDIINNTESDINDYLHINEANIGVNKANIKVLRETSYTATINNDATITSQISHTLFNENEKDNYKAYIRALTPNGSSLQSISIDGEEQEITAAIEDATIYERSNFVAPEGLEVDSNITSAKQSFGFIVNVEAGKRQEIKITYTNGLSIPSKDTINYSLLVQKQPGTIEYPFNLTLNYGDNYSIKEVENAILKERGVSISNKIGKDERFVIELIKR